MRATRPLRPPPRAPRYPGFLSSSRNSTSPRGRVADRNGRLFVMGGSALFITVGETAPRRRTGGGGRRDAPRLSRSRSVIRTGHRHSALTTGRLNPDRCRRQKLAPFQNPQAMARSSRERAAPLPWPKRILCGKSPHRAPKPPGKPLKKLRHSEVGNGRGLHKMRLSASGYRPHRVY